MHQPRRPSKNEKVTQSSKWEAAPGAPDKSNTPCIMHVTRLCQLDVILTNNYHGTKKDISTQCVREDKRTVSESCVPSRNDSMPNRATITETLVKERYIVSQ